MHSGIGPFDIESGSNMSFVKADWNHRAMRASFYLNLLDGQAENVLDPGNRRPAASPSASRATPTTSISATRVFWGAITS